MAFARDVYTAGAAQTDFTITFPYLDGVDVLVYANGVLQTAGTDYNIVSTTIVRFVSGRTSGDTIVIQRATSQTSRLVDYATASTLTEEDLDNDSLQAFYMAQESIDIANTAMIKGSTEEWNFANTQSENVPTPTSGDSVANKSYVDSFAAAAGNVPTPDNPGEDNYFLKASGGTFDWADLFGGANTWTGVQTFSERPVVQTSDVEGILMESSRATSGSGPTLRLRRTATSYTGFIGNVSYEAKNDAGSNKEFARILGSAIVNTAGAEDGTLKFYTTRGGTSANRMLLQDGLSMDGATGADKGAGTINATAFYVNGEGPVGKVLQVGKTVTGAVATGTTVIPADDTIPQNTEGDEYMTLAFTPKSSSSRLKIEVVVHLSHSSASGVRMFAALFRDSTAAAIAAGWAARNASAGAGSCVVFTHDMASPGTSATTFKVRAGSSVAGTTTFNGVSGARELGGICASSIVITEYLG